MRRSKVLKASLLVFAVAALGLGVVAARGRIATEHAVLPASLGTPSRGGALDAIVEEPGPVVVETVYGADWQVPLSGLLNLEHPEARRAGLADRDEPIQITFHALRHPTRGTFIVDTGIERLTFEAPERALFSGLVGRVMHADKIRRREDTATWVTRQSAPVAGVFLTHLHLDHVSGMRDVPEGTPVFVGPGEASARGFEHLFGGPIVDRALVGKPALSEWRFERDPDGAFEGVVDVFGDRTVFALWVPGHTPGSTAYVARTPTGPVLLTGDACHTRWGWDHGVEPGTFSHDRPRSAESLARMKRFAERHPKLDVRVGHQGGGPRVAPQQTASSAAP